MKCNIHPKSEAIGTCTSCGKSVCSECAVQVRGKLVCRDCLATGKTSTTKDPDTAFLIELIGGFFGLLGVGYLYVGRTNDGIVRLVLWVMYDIVAAIIISLLISVLIGCLCIPLQLAIQICVPIWSASGLKKSMLA
jgi:hypothetical protein